MCSGPFYVTEHGTTVTNYSCPSLTFVVASLAGEYGLAQHSSLKLHLYVRLEEPGNDDSNTFRVQEVQWQMSFDTANHIHTLQIQ